MGHKVITPVAGDVIPLVDLRQHLRLDLLGNGTHPDDALIQGYLGAAREYCEHYLQRSVGVQTLELALDAFPDGGIHLPLGAASITSVTYVDTVGIVQTVSSTAYTLDDYSLRHWAIPVTAWPSAGAVVNAVRVRYVTPATATIPQAVRNALLLLTGHLYENREAVNTERGVVPTEVPFGVKSMLDTCRDWTL